MLTFLTPDRLDETLESLLIGKPMQGGRKFLGIEVERLLLDRRTQESAPLEFCRQLLADIAATING